MSVEFERLTVEPPGAPPVLPERPRLDPGKVLSSLGQASPPAQLLLAAFVCGIAILYLSTFVDRGWIPHDEGLLAHSADRLLSGELPHRDFEDAYTGGLTFLHAAAFQLLGVRLLSLRWVLLAAAVAFVPALYWIAARTGVRRMAPLTLLCCVAWSLPNYFAGLPSWYVLILSVLGAVALLQSRSSDSRLWLAAAGMCGGLALLMKITGLYFIAAGLLFLLYRSQVRSAAESSQPRSGVGGVLLVLAVSGVLLSLELLLLKRDLRSMELLQFFVPTAALCVFLVVNEWRQGRGRLFSRLTTLTIDMGALLTGFAVPVLLFAAVFAVNGALGDLIHGVFVLPRTRLELAKSPLPPLISMLPVLLPAAILLPPCLGWARTGPVPRILFQIGLTMVALLLLIAQSGSYYWIFLSLRGLLPVLVGAACLVLLRRSDGSVSDSRRQELFLLAAVASLLSLTQYPQSYEIYFCYCAPLVLLLLHALTGMIPAPARWTTVGLMGFYLVFGVLTLNAGYGVTPGNSRELFSHRLEMERGGLRVRPESAQEYDSVVAAIRQASPAHTFIYAAPDCPEIYFLTDRGNPTPTMFDFFDSRPDRADRILQALDEKQVQVIVINGHPLFSSKIDGKLAEELHRRFPHRRTIGRFVVAVRDAPRHGTELLSLD